MDKETMEFLKAMQESLLQEVRGIVKDEVNGVRDELKADINGLKGELQSVKQELQEFRVEFKEHAAQSDEKFRELLNIVKDNHAGLKKDIKELRDYVEGIAEVQGRHEADIKWLKKQVM